MEQVQEPQAPLVRRLDALQFALQEVGSLDGLHNARLTRVVGGLQLLEVQRALHVVAGELRVHGGERVLEPLIKARPGTPSRW